MKEQELEELRQQEANKTALAAIGPRKKRKFDDLVCSPSDALARLPLVWLAFVCVSHIAVLSAARFAVTQCCDAMEIVGQLVDLDGDYRSW